MRRIMPFLMLLVGLSALLANPGCQKAVGPNAERTFKTVGQKIGGARDAAMPMAGVADERRAEAEVAHREAAQEAPNLPAPGGFAANQQQPPAQKAAKIDQPRKIRYNAELRVIVRDFAKAETDLETAIEEAKGEKSKAEINNSPGSMRNGHWKVRVPVGNLHSFRKAVAKLGDAEKDTLDSEDMTAQYYDLQEHIKNLNAQRETTRELLRDVGKQNLQQYFTVKHELDRITDDINRKEGQLRLWANLTDLSTVNIYLREKQKYDDTDKVVKDREDPTFGQRASRTFGTSWDTFMSFCQFILLVLIALAPWLPLLLIPAGAVWLLVRSVRRMSTPQKPQKPQEQKAKLPQQEETAPIEIIEEKT